MNILAIDTSTAVLSIALRTDNSYEERLVNGPFSHSEDLLPEIERLLSRVGMDISEITLVIVAKGPGSFTGLRIAMASAKGLASALSIPLVSIPTLDVIAMAASPWDGPVLSKTVKLTGTQAQLDEALALLTRAGIQWETVE